jgi:hypothetical protein
MGRLFALVLLGGVMGCAGTGSAQLDAEDSLVDRKADGITDALLGEAELAFNEKLLCDPTGETSGCIARDQLPGKKSRARFDSLGRKYPEVAAWSLPVEGQPFFAVTACEGGGGAEACFMDLYTAKDKRVAHGEMNLEIENLWDWTPNLLPMTTNVPRGGNCGSSATCAAGLTCAEGSCL